MSRQVGVLKKADALDTEVMPVTWDECILVNHETPLSTILSQKSEEGQVFAVAQIDTNGKPTAWKYIDVATSGGKDYRITEAPSGDYAKSYKLQFKGEDDEWTDAPESFVINVPKDMVVESGSVKTCTEADTPVQGYEVGDKYIDLVIANSDDEHIYILVSDLVNNAADGISYDNTESGLEAENVQEAIDELAENKADKTEISNVVKAPQTAEVGQVLAVKAVDENGKPTEWECVEKGGGDEPTPTPSDDSPLVWFIIDKDHTISWDIPDSGAITFCTGSITSCNYDSYNVVGGVTIKTYEDRCEFNSVHYSSGGSTISIYKFEISNGRFYTYDPSILGVIGFLKSDVEKYNIQQKTK